MFKEQIAQKWLMGWDTNEKNHTDYNIIFIF